jgi:hypothetical protein
VRDPDDECLRRIQTIAAYHDLADWRLQYTSDDDSWAFTLTLPIEEAEEHSQEVMPGLQLRMQMPSAPVFAMRCQSLVVLAEALEHWQAHLLTKDDAP